MKKRYTIVDYPKTNKNTGIYTGKNPKQAAKKALSRLSRDNDINNNKQKDTKLIVFELKCLDNNKIYKFIGTRVRLNKPRIINRGGKEVKFNFTNLVSYYDDYVN